MSKRDTKRAKRPAKLPQRPAIECDRCGEWYSPDDLSIANIHIKRACKIKEDK